MTAILRRCSVGLSGPCSEHCVKVVPSAVSHTHPKAISHVEEGWFVNWKKKRNVFEEVTQGSGKIWDLCMLEIYMDLLM